MQTRESLNAYKGIEKDQVNEAYKKAVELVRNQTKWFGDKFPDSSSTQNFYLKTENVEWTTGFYTGEIWLAYEQSKDQALLEAGSRHVDSFLRRIEQNIDVNHHDMGFLYSPSCVAAYLLTGNEKARKAALLAADHLMERFQEKGQFFQAWGNLGEADNYRLIIDCLLNMPLLFWASSVTGNLSYEAKARSHIETAMKYVIRPDHSTYHTYYFDPTTGMPLRGVTHQGNRNGSAWARGQAWGIYGAALSYKRIKNPQYIRIFKELTEYFLLHLPKDLVPFWDFDFDDGSREPRDSSASAIAICGMLEMALHLPEEEAKVCSEDAKRLLLALVRHCAVSSAEESNGLLLHGTYARASVNNPCSNRGVDECNTWGDYFYMEALARLSGGWNSFW